jgi:mRNA interferase MazF
MVKPARHGYVPDRGDIVWVNLNPTKGHEQANVRPALVLTPLSYNTKTSLCIACPITSTVREYPFEVTLKAKKLSGVVLVDQVRSFDWRARLVEKADTASLSTVTAVQQKLSLLVL